MPYVVSMRTLNIRTWEPSKSPKRPEMSVIHDNNKNITFGQLTIFKSHIVAIERLSPEKFDLYLPKMKLTVDCTSSDHCRSLLYILRNDDYESVLYKDHVNIVKDIKGEDLRARCEVY